MILNNVEVNVLSTMKLIDAYNSNFPEDFLMENIIYCIHNDINGKNYVGQTVKVINRFSKTYVGHFKDYDKFVNGKLSETRALYRAWKKYGLESFTVFAIDTGSCREELNEKEVYWIKTLHTCVKDPDCFGYNLTWGADDMSVSCRESIEKSLETRRKIYGEAFANCHTPEAFAKGNKTKEERYGHGGFVNASTPEANEKRKQTNLERYGTLHGPKASEEAIQRMINKKMEEYRDPMGVCNTPENRKKAVNNLTITNTFTQLGKNISNAKEEINTFEDYYKTVLLSYSSISNAKRHFYKLIGILPKLKEDNRWSAQFENIFGDLTIEFLDKKFEIIEKQRKDEARKKLSIANNPEKLSISFTIKSIKFNLSRKDGNKITTWEDYKKLVLTSYHTITKGKNHLNKIIELLPKLRLNSSWKQEYEAIFGKLTEKDRIAKKGESK